MTNKILILLFNSTVYFILQSWKPLGLFLLIFIIEIFSLEILFLYILEYIEKKWSNHGKPCPRIPADHLLAIEQILIDTVEAQLRWRLGKFLDIVLIKPIIRPLIPKVKNIIDTQLERLKKYYDFLDNYIQQKKESVIMLKKIVFKL